MSSKAQRLICSDRLEGLTRYRDSDVAAVSCNEVIALAKELVAYRKAEVEHLQRLTLQSQLDQLSGKLEGAVAGLSARVAALEARQAVPQWPGHGLPWSPTYGPTCKAADRSEQ